MWRVVYISTPVSINCRLEFGTAPATEGSKWLCPINCRLELAQPQLQKWTRCSTAVFPKMFTFREKWSQVPPVLGNYNVTSPPLRTAAPLRFATVYNKLTGGGGGCFVSPFMHPAYLAPALCMFGLLSIVLSASPIAPT
jgi:hypothetical protein